MAQDWTWDKAYADYAWTLQNGEVTEDKIRSWYEPLSKDFADRIVAIHKDLANQQKASVGGGKTLGDQWYGGDIGKDDATWDFAFRLAETGAGSLYDIGQRQVEKTIEGEGGPYSTTDFELFNKRTGEPLTRFNQAGFDNIYNLQFTPDGMPVAYTENETSDWVDFREGAKFLANTIGMFTPAAPYIAAANAANYASKGEWEKAILSAAAAAGPIAADFNVGTEALNTIKNVADWTKVYKAATEGDIFQAALSAASASGSSVIPGTDIKVADAARAAAVMKAAEQGRWFDAAIGAGTLAGYDTIPGTPISLNELNKAASTTQKVKKAFETENPFLLVSALQQYGKPPTRLTPEELDALSGDELMAVRPGDTFSGGAVDLLAPDQGVDTLGLPGMVEASPSEELLNILGDMPEAEIVPTPIEIPEIVAGLPDQGVVEVVGKKFPEERATFPEFPEIELTPDDLSKFLVEPTPIEIPEIVAGLPDQGVVEVVGKKFPATQYPEFPEIELTPEDLALTPIVPTPIEIPEIAALPDYGVIEVVGKKFPEERAKFPEYPQIELTPEDLAPPEIVPTPIDIPPIVGPAPAPAPKPPAAPAPKPPAAPAPAPFDLSGLLLLLGGQQQGPIPLTVPDNSADIKLMEEIFGTSLSAPSTGNETDMAAALARLLRS